jgi:hypothetical protein
MPDTPAPEYELLRPSAEQSGTANTSESPEETRKRKRREWVRRYRQRPEQREWLRRHRQSEEVRAKRREYQRRFERSEKGKAYQRCYQQSHRDAQKRYEAGHSEEIKARRAKYRLEHKEQIRQYRIDHRQQISDYRRRWSQRRQSVAEVRTSPEEVYRRAIAALPSGLPRFIRDDVVSSLCLAILEGEINVNDMAAQAKVYLRAYNREYDTFQTVSLDVLIPGTKTTYSTLWFRIIPDDGLGQCRR